MDKDAIERLTHLASWLEEIKKNVQAVETTLIEIIKREEHKYKILHPEYEAEEGWWQKPNG